MTVVHERIEWAVVVALGAIAVVLWTVDLVGLARVLSR